MKDITVEEFEDLRNRISLELRNTNQFVENSALANRMLDFEKLFPGGLAHMRNYIKWSEEHGYEDYILPTIVHDLNDMNEPCFLPRTSDY